MRRMMLMLALAIPLMFLGCAAAEKAGDWFFSGGDQSAAVGLGKKIVDSGILGTWGEAALLALTGLQNLYLGQKVVRKTVKRRRERKQPVPA